MNIPVRLDSRANLQADLQNPARMQIWRCPAQKEVQICRLWEDFLYFAPPDGITSYAYNENVLGYRALPEKDRLFGYWLKVVRPSEVMLFADGNRRTEWDARHITLYGGLPDQTLRDCWLFADAGTPSVFPLERHGGLMNVVFVDGHAATVRIPHETDKIGVSKGIR
jgi:prepilin-type processing-associated H-X9-DG protein